MTRAIKQVPTNSVLVHQLPPTAYLQAAGDAVIIVTPAMEINFINRRAEDLWQYSRDEAAGKSLESLFPDLSQAAFSGEQSGPPGTYRTCRKDGAPVMVSASIGTLTEAGQDGYLLICRPVNEDLSAAGSVYSLKAQFETALTSLTDAVFISDAKGNFIDLNQAFADFMRFKTKEECARTLTDYPRFVEVFLDNGDEPTPLDMWALPRALRGETGSNIEYGIRRNDTGERWLGSFSFAPIRSQDGSIVGAVVVARDITEQKKMEADLQASREQFRAAFEYSAVGMCLTGVDGHIHLVNQAMCEMFGYSKMELEGRHFNDITYPEDYSIGREIVRSMMDGERPSITIEKRYVKKNGEYFWASVSAALIRDKDGSPHHFVTQITDVTEQKRTEQIILKNDRILKLFIDHAPAAIAMFDKDMRYIAVSRRFLQDYNLREQDLIGKLHYEIFPEIPEQVKEVHRRCLAGAVESCEEDMLPRADGKTDWMRWEVRPWYDSDGEIGGIILFTEVITKRKLAELAAEKYTQRLEILNTIDRAILRASKPPESVVSRSLVKTCRLLDCRRAALAKLDMNSQTLSLIRVNADGDIEQNEEQKFDDQVMEALQNLREEHMEIHDGGRSAPDPSVIGSIIPVDRQNAYINLALHSEGGIIGLVSYDWNKPTAITPEMLEIALEVGRELAIAIEQSNLRQASADYAVELERRVAKRTVDLELSNQDLQAFAYSVSHDLRAPLRSIQGFAQILEEDHSETLNDEGRRLLGIIQRSTIKMDQLITDILALSRVGLVDMNLSRFNMNAMVKSVYDEITSQDEKRKCILILEDLPEAQADQTLIHHVWTNLISNAIKYTSPKPECLIEISGVEKDGFCEYTIRDNGVGFDPAFEKKIFGLFQRLHKESEFEGTGVGLAIVQRIIQRHGGRVWAEGQVGQGAAFHFSLPAPASN